jgi:hypothetical protein
MFKAGAAAGAISRPRRLAALGVAFRLTGAAGAGESKRVEDGGQATALVRRTRR